MDPAILVFLLVYFLIITETINKTTAAMGGAVLMIALGIISEKQAFASISFSTIATVIGILIMVEVVRRAGVFSYLAIKTVKVTKGSPKKLMVLLSLLSFAMSALLNSVTAIIILGSLTVVVCKELKLSLPPFLIAEDLISGLGAMTLMISSVSNILIAKAAGFSFTFFLSKTIPLIILLLPLTIIFFILYFKLPAQSEIDLSHFDENSAITNKNVFYGAAGVLVLVIFSFAFSERLGLSIEFIAIAGGVLSLLVSQLEPENILGKVPWDMIFFFSGLFVIMGGLQASGALGQFANQISPYVGGGGFGNLVFLWITSLLSGFTEDVSLTTALIPIIGALKVATKVPLYWGAVIAANIGSNLTPIGSVSSLLALGMARNAGDPIDFKQFLKVGLILSLMQLVVCSIYVYLVF